MRTRRWTLILSGTLLVWLLSAASCDGGGGGLEPTRILRFDISPNPTTPGSSVTLTWEAQSVGLFQGNPYCTLQRRFEGESDEPFDVVDCSDTRIDTIDASVTASHVDYRFSALRRGSTGTGGSYEQRDVRLELNAPAATITLTPDQATLLNGETRTFTATLTGISDTTVTWAATCGTITGTNNTITYTAPAAPTTCTITATSTVDSSLAASATITVVPDPVIGGIALDPDQVILLLGSDVQLTVLYSGVVGQPDLSVSWATSNDAIATVDDGLVTAVAVGTATITATSLFDSSLRASATVTVEALDATFVRISAGEIHSLALDQSGNAWAWGSNAFGQLGDGTTGIRVVPAAVSMPGGVTFTAVSAGLYHSLALDTSGNAWAWGDNWTGQLGDGTTADRLTPVAVSMPSGISFIAVSAGGDHSLALDTSGNAWAWGENSAGQLGLGTTSDNSLVPLPVDMPAFAFTAISAGAQHSLALDTVGNAWAWGGNIDGQLGDGGTGNQLSPVAVSMPSVAFAAVSAGGSISAGGYHSAALDRDGNAWAWGSNFRGQLGIGSTVGSELTPVLVVMPSGTVFTSIAAHGEHTLAIDTSGNAWGWGDNFWGQVGDGGDEPRAVPTNVSMPVGVVFEAISAGYEHSLALDADGNAWAWGRNQDGRLGDGSAVTERRQPGAVSMP